MKLDVVQWLLRLFAISGIFLLLSGCGGVQLYTNLNEQEANEMIAILDQNSIKATKGPAAEGRFQLQVAESDFARSIDVLKANAFPQEQFQTLGEVFKKSGLVSSPTEERIRFMYALSQSISETISHIDGVITARVHIVLPGNDPTSNASEASSAAVFIKYMADADVERFIPQIKNLVRDSVQGLSYDRVSVVFFPVERTVLSPGPVTETVSTPSSIPDSAGMNSASALVNFLRSPRSLVLGGTSLVALILFISLFRILGRRRRVPDFQS